MKKRHNAFGETITSRDVRPFVVVARKACKRQILGSSKPAVLTRKNVINLKREFVVLLRQPAIHRLAERAARPDVRDEHSS